MKTLLALLCFCCSLLSQAPAGVTASLSGAPFTWYDSASDVTIAVVWTPPTSPTAAVEAILYTLETPTATVTVTVPGSTWPITGWPDGAEYVNFGPLPDANDGTIEIGRLVDGVYEPLFSTFPFVISEVGEGGSYTPPTSACGSTLTISWQNLTLPGGFSEITLVLTAVSAAPDHANTGGSTHPVWSHSVTIAPFEYASGTYTTDALPSYSGAYAVEVAILPDGVPGDYGPGFGTTYSEVACGGGGGGGGDGTGAWDQPEIDTLLARQSELVALAESASTERGAILAELQAISTALGSSSGLTQAQLSEVLGAPNTNPANDTTPNIAGDAFASALATKLPSAVMPTGSAAGFSIPLPLPNGQTHEVEFTLDPSAMGVTGAGLDTARGIVRSFIVALIGIWLVRSIWLALRQY